MIEHKKVKEGTFLWWLLSLIPVLNLYWNWRVSKLIAGHQER